jgi:hypothetical protein
MGPQTDKTSAARYLYRSIFKMKTFGIAFYQTNLPAYSPMCIATRMAGQKEAMSYSLAITKDTQNEGSEKSSG